MYELMTTGSSLMREPWALTSYKVLSCIRVRCRPLQLVPVVIFMSDSADHCELQQCICVALASRTFEIKREGYYAPRARLFNLYLVRMSRRPGRL